jgi:hypothetical protein
MGVLLKSARLSSAMHTRSSTCRSTMSRSMLPVISNSQKSVLTIETRNAHSYSRRWKRRARARGKIVH